MSENSGPDLTGTQLQEGGGMTYLLRLPSVKIDKPVPALVMMHGRGANEGDIYELVPYVDKRVLVVAPRAPMLNSDDPRGSFKWYDISQPGDPAEGGIDASVRKVIKFIEQLGPTLGVEIDPAQIYIGGFSQGAAMSYAVVSERPELVAGVIGHSGPFNDRAEARLRQANLKGKPFFVAHGTQDFLKIDEHGRRAAKVLKEIGTDLTYKEYDFAHETTVESRHDLADWLNSRLKF